MKRFYVCEICGNLISMIDDSGVVPHCCNVQMTELTQQTEDMGQEKHVPVLMHDGVKLEIGECSYRLITIKIGDEPHPMTREHHIKWIVVETTSGCYRLKLDPLGPPEAHLWLKKTDKIRAVYAYCNIHGLWVNKKVIEE